MRRLAAAAAAAAAATTTTHARGAKGSGAVAARNVVGQPVMTQSGLVRMQVSGRHAARASVTIYMTGTYRLSVFDRYAGREVYRSGPCVSTGALEKRIFAFLDS